MRAVASKFDGLGGCAIGDNKHEYDSSSVREMDLVALMVEGSPYTGSGSGSGWKVVDERPMCPLLDL